MCVDTSQALMDGSSTGIRVLQSGNYHYYYLLNEFAMRGVAASVAISLVSYSGDTNIYVSNSTIMVNQYNYQWKGEDYLNDMIASSNATADM